MNKDLVENVKVTDISIGSSHFDGRGFSGFSMEGDSWCLGWWLPFTKKAIDKFIEVCGGTELYKCKGSYIRIEFLEEKRGSFCKVKRIYHIVKDDVFLDFEEERENEQKK